MMSRHMLFPPFRDARGALTLSVILTSLVPPPAAVLDRRAPSSDGQEAQHPQHVRHRARRPRKCPNRATRARFRRRLRRRIDRALGTAVDRVWLGGREKTTREARRPRRGRVPPTQTPRTSRRRRRRRSGRVSPVVPTPPAPAARTPPRLELPLVHRRFVAVGRGDRGSENAVRRVFSHTIDDEKKTNADVPLVFRLPSLPPSLICDDNRVSPPSRTPSSPPRVSSRRRTRATRA
jgi:hypothetical protein